MRRRSNFDYLVVGAGFFGATAARRLADAGKRVLVIDQADHVAGMAHTEWRDGQLYQNHGGHIFHTNDKRLWDWVNRFAEFKHYSHHVKAMAGGRAYSLPINLTTLNQVYPDLELTTPIRGTAFLAGFANGHTGDNVRDWCLQNIGPELYGLLVEGYTRKQWGREPEQIPASVIKRLPVRTTWDDHYFGDAYQGLPINGYTELVGNMLDGIKVELGLDYCDRVTYWDDQADRVIYTGPLDRLYGYQIGRLEYRSLRFEHFYAEVPDHQGCATMNYCDSHVPWLRDEEWRHWWAPAQPKARTLVTRTSPDLDGSPMYPINDARNQALYEDYARWAASRHYMRVGGRLGLYRYLDMHQAIAAAHKLADDELS